MGQGMSGSRRSIKLRVKKNEGVIYVEVLASKVIRGLRVFIEDRIRPFDHNAKPPAQLSSPHNIGNDGCLELDRNSILKWRYSKSVCNQTSYVVNQPLEFNASTARSTTMLFLGSVFSFTLSSRLVSLLFMVNHHLFTKPKKS